MEALSMDHEMFLTQKMEICAQLFYVVHVEWSSTMFFIDTFLPNFHLPLSHENKQDARMWSINKDIDGFLMRIERKIF